MKPTTDEVLAWARSVGMEITDDTFVNFNVWELKRVCTLAYAAGAAAMKERAAKECDEIAEQSRKDSKIYDCQEDASYYNRQLGAEKCADVIRALGDDDE